MYAIFSRFDTLCKDPPFFSRLVLSWMQEARKREGDLVVDADEKEG